MRSYSWLSVCGGLALSLGCSSEAEDVAPGGTWATGGSAAAGGLAATGGAANPGSSGTAGGTAGSGGTSGTAGTAGQGGNPISCPADFGVSTATAWTEYVANPNAHPNIPNVSYAGYHNGDRALPAPVGPIIDVRASHGAKGDGVSDDTDEIRAALAAVGATGGVVFFPPGTYVLSGPLFVHTNATVLRGAGREQTALRFTNSLSAGYGVSKTSSGQSRWSWSGGLVWFGPESTNTYGGAADFTEGWNIAAELTKITSAPVRGDFSFEVTDGFQLHAGDYVFIEIDNAPDLSVVKHLTGEGAWADSYDWSPDNSERVLPMAKPRLPWAVQVAAVAGNTVTLKQPLRFDLRSEWKPSIRAMGDVVRDSGIESLTIELERDYTYSFSSHHNKEPGWNGAWFNNAVDCFARDVTIVDADTGIGTSAAKNVTIAGLTLAASSDARVDHHHGTTTRNFSQDVLFQDFKISSRPRHGINVEGFSMGIVWSRGTMEHGTFDTHRALPLDCVHTEISVNNDGRRGGAADAGPVMGARFVNWNVQVINATPHMVADADLMPSGAIVGVSGVAIAEPGNAQCLIEQSGSSAAAVEPANLHDAQLALRLCGQ